MDKTNTPELAQSSPPTSAHNARWYQGVTRYQWLILVIASAGWIFDVYESQIFNLTRNQLLTDILGSAGGPAKTKFYGEVFLGIFLLGGTAGGILFGALADRWGRRPTMAVTILVYSLSSGLMYFTHSLWQVGVMRFLVAMGVGGEWAVAASLVAEVFPARARAHASAIFHASSVLGTGGATLAGIAVAENWRAAYLIGVLPAILVAWVMASVQEPESWKQARASARPDEKGSIAALLSNPVWLKRAMFGMLLAAVGLGTYWAVAVAGQDLARNMLLREGVGAAQAERGSKFAYGIVEAFGAGIGLVSFGPLCAWLGRRKAFAIMLIAACVIVPITCYAPQTYHQLLFLLPVFGFLTTGMHAGFAVYFPELFPARLRATGTGFCFNAGRTLAATMLFFSGWLKTQIELRFALTLLALLFPLGLLVLYFLPETKDRPLPE